MILQGIMLILLLGIAPLGTGLLINGSIEEENRSIGVTYICGFLILLAVFQLISVPIVFVDPWGFDWIIKIYTGLLAIFTGWGIVHSLHMWRKGEGVFKEKVILSSKTRSEWIQWMIVFVLIGFQMVMAVTHASFDGDDAYYVVQSVITDETNTLYRILPYTGLTTSLDMRHSMAVFPVWIAYVARMTGIHATVLSHTVLPLLLIPLTYGIYYEIGKKLFLEKTEQLSVYMMFVCFLHIFGNVSIYSNATFLLMRTWQGKSMLANVVIPVIFMVVLWLFEGGPEKRKGKKIFWFMLFVINIVAAMMSTASVFLNTILIFVMAVVFAIKEKNRKIILQMFMCCIPCVVYALLYVLL